MASWADRTARAVRLAARMRAIPGSCAKPGADFFAAAVSRILRRRADIEIYTFFRSRTKLTRESGGNSCASGQTWYRNGTELVLAGRKLDGTCTKSVLVGTEVEKQTRSGCGAAAAERQSGDWHSQVLVTLVCAARDGIHRVLVRRILWQAGRVQFFW